MPRTKKQKTIPQSQLPLSSELETTLNKFIEYLPSSGKGKSTNTISAYALYVREYLLHTNDYHVTRDSITSYKSYLINEKHNSVTTHNAKLSALRAYNEFLVYSNLQDSLVILKKDFISIQKSVISPYDVPDKQIYNFLDKIKEKESFRNYAIAYVMAFTGLRVSECLDIKLTDLNYNEHELSVIGKGNKYRTVTLTDDVIDVINEYRNQHREETDSVYLFISRKNTNGGKLARHTINKVFEKYSKIITPHTLRHFRADELVNKSGLTIIEAAFELGHSNIATTGAYTFDKKQNRFDKLNRMNKAI